MCVSLQHLPGLSAAAVGAGKAVSSLLRKVPDAAHPLAQDCFKLLGGRWAGRQLITLSAGLGRVGGGGEGNCLSVEGGRRQCL